VKENKEVAICSPLAPPLLTLGKEVCGVLAPGFQF
jgi:hypothetical protein